MGSPESTLGGLDSNRRVSYHALALGMFDEIFKRILDKLKGADFWIALGFLAVGIVCWRWIGTAEGREAQVFHRQITVAFVLLASAGIAIAIRHRFFKRESVFT